MSSETEQRTGRGTSSPWPALKIALGVVWVPWLLARVLTVTALSLARYLTSHVEIHSTKAITAAHEGLNSWDASWYLAIARGGYGSLPTSGLRFFPLYPEVLHFGHVITQAPTSLIALIVANTASLVAAVLLYLLARRELDQRAASRSVWLLCLAPASFVLVMGYAESLLLCFAIGTFLALRRRAFLIAGLLGLLAGLTRPLGLILVLPAVVEAFSGFNKAAVKERLARIAAVLGPLVGTGIYLAWVATAFGDFLLPLRAQTSSSAHGGLSNPLVVTYDALRDLFHGHVGRALHVPWIALSLILLVVCWKKLPLAYGIFAAGVLVAALSGHNLESFERYALTAFPLLIAAGTLLRSERVATPVLILSSAGLFGYAVLAFLGAYVP